MNVLSLFDGISIGRLSLENAGIKIDNYLSSEIENKAIEISQKNYGIKYDNLGSVCDIDFYDGIVSSKNKSRNVGKIDLIIGGSPCQDLSNLKNGLGLEGEKSKLLMEFVRLKEKINPRYFLLENVVPRKQDWKYEIDKLVGVEGFLINSDLFVPQNRPRIYWTNIPINELPKRPNWNEVYYQWRRTYFRKNMSGVCPCLTANMGTGGHNVPLKSMDLKDKLSPEECEALQGLPRGFTSGVANSHRYKSIGNGWTSQVISHIFNGLPNEYKIEPTNKPQQTLF